MNQYCVEFVETVDGEGEARTFDAYEDADKLFRILYKADYFFVGLYLVKDFNDEEIKVWDASVKDLMKLTCTDLDRI